MPDACHGVLRGLRMKFTEIRNTVIARMTAQTIIDGKDVLYLERANVDDPSGKLIWAQLRDILRAGWS